MPRGKGESSVSSHQLSAASGWTERRSPIHSVQGMQGSLPLLSHRREVRADATEVARSFFAAEAPAHFLLQFHHPQVSLRLVVIKGNSKVRHEAQHLLLLSLHPQQQVARLLVTATNLRCLLRCGSGW